MMKHRLLLSLLFLVFVFSSCSHEPEDTYDRFDFYIDSIYNISSSSATVKATLTNYKPGTIHISGLYLEISKTQSISENSWYKELDFDKKEGVVELTITNLNSNTPYYITPMGRFNGPYKNEWGAHITSYGSPNAIQTFTTLIE